MVTQDVWRAFSKEEKVAKITEALIQLDDIGSGKHHLIGSYAQGRLSNVKQALEAFVLNTAEWESNKTK